MRAVAAIGVSPEIKICVANVCKAAAAPRDGDVDTLDRTDFRLGLIGNVPIAHGARIVVPLSNPGLWRSRQRPKSPHRRCFGEILEARATLGARYMFPIVSRCKHFCGREQKILDRASRVHEVVQRGGFSFAFSMDLAGMALAGGPSLGDARA